jgi:hypothetical protein
MTALLIAVCQKRAAVSSVMVNIIVCAPALIAFLAVCATGYFARRRRRRQAAEWERVRPGLSGLDADLDRTWAREQERIRRYL